MTTPLEALKILEKTWFDSHYPLEHCVMDAESMTTVGEWVREVIKEAESKNQKATKE